MPQDRVRRLLRENGLLLACPGLFSLFFLGMIVSGWAVYNQEQQEHGAREQVSLVHYLSTGDFVEATFENWESEFLQMGMYVVLTAFLRRARRNRSRWMSPHPRTTIRVTPRRTGGRRGRYARVVGHCGSMKTPWP